MNKKTKLTYKVIESHFEPFLYKLRPKTYNHETIQDLLNKAEKGKTGDGKSKSLFWSDKKYIVKTMTPYEYTHFQTTAESYVKHILESKENTLLNIIYAVYDIRVRNRNTLRVIVTNNILNPINNPEKSYKFDLKGAIKGRLVNTNEPPTKTRKDRNLCPFWHPAKWRSIDCSYPFIISKTDYDKLMVKLDNDSTFLRKSSIMDYSLFVVFSNSKKKIDQPGLYSIKLKQPHPLQPRAKMVVMGMIDILTSWSWYRTSASIIQNKGHIFSSRRDQSQVAPYAYKLRFMRFFKTAFKSG
tara:strand:+ start:1343 stop:2236 length:894 start_codon:yes stop_codon:yes gene_type:complete